MKKRTKELPCPLWFKFLTSLFCFILAAGIVYGILAYKGVFSHQHTLNTGDTSFAAFLQIGAEESSRSEITADLIYDPAFQKLVLKFRQGDQTYTGGNYIRISRENFIEIIDRAGGIPLENETSEITVLNGTEAYDYATAGKPDELPQRQAQLFTAFYYAMRQYSDDEIFALKLLSYAYFRIDTNIRLKAISDISKNIIKADSVELEIIYDEYA